jgi:DNA polymerase-3 subunit delta
MPARTEAQVRRALEQGEVAPVYLLLGDDEVGKDGLIAAFTALVEPDLQGFNVERFHATDSLLSDVLAAARTLPLLGARRVVFWMRAEVVLKRKPRGGRAEPAGEGPDETDAGVPPEGEEPDVADLERYLASPSPSTCLVIVAADVDRGRRVGRQLLQQAVVVEFWGLKGGREARGADRVRAVAAAEAFVRDRVRAAGLSIDRDAVVPLVEHAGTDIGLLRNAVERVMTYCHGRSIVRIDDVRAVVSGAVPLDDWAVITAIEHGDAAEAVRQLGLLLDQGAAPLQLLGQIAWFVRERLAVRAPHRARMAVEAVFRTDQALKRSAGDPQVLLERLVMELSFGQARGSTPAPAGRRPPGPARQP